MAKKSLPQSRRCGIIMLLLLCQLLMVKFITTIIILITSSLSCKITSQSLRPVQWGQIWRYFATWVKFQKFWAVFVGLVGKISKLLWPIFMLLGKFSVNGRILNKYSNHLVTLLLMRPITFKRACGLVVKEHLHDWEFESQHHILRDHSSNFHLLSIWNVPCKDQVAGVGPSKTCSMTLSVLARKLLMRRLVNYDRNVFKTCAASDVENSFAEISCHVVPKLTFKN